MSFWIVTQQAQVGDIGSCGQMFRHIIAAPNNATTSNVVHRRNPRRLQRCSAPQRLLGFVGASIRNDNRVLHQSSTRKDTAGACTLCSSLISAIAESMLCSLARSVMITRGT